MEEQFFIVDLFVTPQVLDARSQQIARAPHDPVNRVTLFQEQLGQIGTVLSRDSGNERNFLHVRSWNKRSRPSIRDATVSHKLESANSASCVRAMRFYPSAMAQQVRPSARST